MPTSSRLISPSSTGSQARGRSPSIVWAGPSWERLPIVSIVELGYSSEDAMQDSLNGPEGQAMARDFQAFASGGVTVLVCQSTRGIDRGAADD